MTELLYYSILVILIFGILIGIAFMSRVEKAAIGNRLSALCTGAAIILALVWYEMVSAADIWIFLLVGLVIGLIGAYRVKMIEMPQTVAVLNGFGGAASAIVAIVALYGGNSSIFEMAVAGLALCIGVPTLTGSLVAAGKLHGVMSQKPVVWKRHNELNTLSVILMLFFLIVMLLGVPIHIAWFIIGFLLVSGFFGIAFAIRVGGADMPITISLLNSLSGLAVSAAGMTVSDPLLVAVGGVIGAAGLILTQIMCKAMNRSLKDILMGNTSVVASVNTSDLKVQDEPAQDECEETGAAVTAVNEEKNNETVALNPKQILAEAKSVIIIPGYGMALAQAQGVVKQLTDKLEANGANVKYAIHPIAGRMPGHMNVLLAEVDVPYDKLYEIDDINPLFEDCDAAIVVGANDVVNPAANTAEDTPIYGMPVLDVEKAKSIIICNYDTQPGYSGVANPLYEDSKAVLLLGDAKDSIGKLLRENAEDTESTKNAEDIKKRKNTENIKDPEDIESVGGPFEGESAKNADAPKQLTDAPKKLMGDPKKLLAEAKSVIIVPGYGMALAQAQGLIKQLADRLEADGTDVKYAIHPVAGRMPGHMNVLLAEVDVSYDKLYEIDDINPLFSDCDVAIVVGANDVVNPAANTETETPIYGMPILNVSDAKRIIICNYDLQPGYSGVPNPLYENEKTILLLGDAKDSVGSLL